MSCVILEGAQTRRREQRRLTFADTGRRGDGALGLSEPGVGTRRPWRGALSAHGPQPGLVHHGRARCRREQPLTPPPGPEVRAHPQRGGRGPGLRRVPQEALPRLPACVWALAQSTQARVPSVTRRHCFRRTRRESKQPTERQPECVETTLPCKELHETARSVSEIQKTTRAFLSWMKTKREISRY